MDSRIVKQDLDRISGLPESILSQIISQLPVDEVVRTSVLAKRWKDSWKYVTRLDINPMKMVKSWRVFVKRDLLDDDEPFDFSGLTNSLFRATGLITSIIQSIQNEVTHCRTVHFPINIISGELQEWVEKLVKRKSFKTLALTCEDVRSLGEVTSLELPPGIFGAIQSLELDHYPLFDLTPFQNCDKLQILKLRRVDSNNSFLSGILFYCKDLKELSLRGCSGFTELHICSRNLKTLELRFLCIDKINISTEALTTLILDTITCFRKFVIINAPRVAEFRAYCRAKGWKKNQDVDVKICLDAEELLERFGGFLSCHEGFNPIYAYRLGYISPFKNLQVLSTSLDLNDIRHAILLSYIFRVCFLLEVLDITVEVRDETILNQCSGSCLYYPEHLFWEKKEVFDSISKYLRVVSVQKFSGKVLEMEFLKYVIRSAPRMLRITIKCDKCCTTEETTAAVSLLSLPRASVDVSVVLEIPGNRKSTPSSSS